MKKNDHRPWPNSARTIHRLTALWALNEAGLAGVLHAVRSPLTGIFIGSLAIILIVLIAYFAENRTLAIMKAAIIVLVIKFTVSPHSPLPAYFAVSFQAFMGVVLFGFLSNFRLASFLLGLLGLLETAIQKVLLLTLFFGNPLWESIDVFVNFVLQQFGMAVGPTGFQASFWLIGLYIGLHIIVGIIIGSVAGVLPRQIQQAVNDPDLARWHDPLATDIGRNTPPVANHWWQRKIFKLAILLAIITAILTFLPSSSNGWSKGLYVLIRAIMALTFWFLLVVPLLSKFIQKLLLRESAPYSREIDHILRVFPQLKQGLKQLWPISAKYKGWQRGKYLVITMIAYALTFEDPELYPEEISEADSANS